MSTLILAVYAVIVIVSVKLCKLYLNRRSFLAKIAYIPGPPALPILGNGLDFKSTAEVLPITMKYTKKYGLSFKVFLGPDTYIFTSDPKLIECLMTSTTQITKSANYRFLYDWLGNGLLTATNPKWKSHRRMLTPTFHFKILDDCIPIFHSNANNLIEHLSKSDGQIIDVHKDVVLCSLDVICEAAMGFSINALKEGNSSDYVNSVKFMAKMVVERTFSIWRQFDLLYKSSPDYKQEKRAVDFLHNVTEKVIKAKRKELFEKKISSEGTSEINEFSKEKLAFLDMLLKCSTEEGGTLSDYDIRQEVATFMFAGHDTISSALSFTLYILSKHPEEQEKAYQEVCKVLGKDRSLAMEKLSELKYLEMVIKESMRIFPPVPMIARELTDDVTFNGQLYPKGLTITMIPYAVHRLEEIYEDPEKFDPERFTSENCAKRSSFAYIPFSAGPRNCIGQKFAMLEMKSLLSSLLLNFEFKPANIPLEIACETVLTALNGIHIKLQKRHKLN